MKLSLLATKTYLPPLPEQHIARPRLEERLEAALRGHQRLILVSAPPGAGKSSLLAGWAAHRGVALAWVSLEAGDDDPAQFWSYCLAALQPHLGEAARGLQEDLAGAADVPPALLPGLVNLLCTRREPLVLALDDYHAIQNPAIHQGVQYLVEHLPAQVCLAITTRVDPPLPVHRWRARGQMTEIRSAELRFTLEEAGQFLTEAMGLALRAAEVQKLEERTEGWATGLQLAALSLQGRDDPAAFVEQFSGSQHFVLDYLMNEVLGQQTPEVQRFLMRTAFLESLCAELCETLLAGDGVGRAQAMLETLSRANLFLVPLDEERAWFRYQHLFRDFLRQRLKRQGEDLPGLHRRAAGWYAANGRVDEAIRHALAAGDVPYAVGLIYKNWQAAASEGRMQAVARWLAALPAAVLAEDGMLSFIYAWVLISTGKTNSLEPHLQNAARFFEKAANPSLAGQMVALRAIQAARAGDLPATQQFVAEALTYTAPELALVRGLAWLAQANLQRELGDFRGAIEAYEKALPLMPLTGMLSGTLVMIATLGQAYWTQGRPQPAEELYRHELAQAAAQGRGNAPAVGMLQIELAKIAYERNRLPEARALLASAEANSRRSGMVDLYASTALLGARLSRLDGDLAGAIRRLEEALEWVRPEDSPHLSAELSAWLARLRAEAGELGKAGAWARGVRPCPEHNPGYTHGIELFALARILRDQERLEEGLSLAARLEELAIAGGSLARAAESRMLQAEMLWRQGRQGEGLARLASSLELAEPAGWVRLFLDEGARLAPLAAAAHFSGTNAWLLEGLRREVAAALPGIPLGEAAPGAELSPKDSSQVGVEALTGRELDVLRGLIAGMTYPEIAARLVISPGTVKTHVSHIYAKLGVAGRVEAIRRAQELKIS